MKFISWNAYFIISIFCFQNIFCDLYSRKYAGNKTAEECIEGPRDPSSKYQRTTNERIELEGYPAENHLVLTEDGYLLTLHRIPGPDGSKPVFLQHGLTLNSYYWVANGKHQSLPFFLSDNGFDVWMGNFRGALYSRCHTNLTTSNRKYWDYSFHEMGVLDLPAMITYVANITNNTIEYVGHSMGTTVLYIFASEIPDVAEKISTGHSFAPVTCMKNMKGFAKLFFDTSYLYKPLVELTGAGNVAAILENNLFRDVVFDFFCGLPITRNICELLYFTTMGFDRTQLNTSRLPDYFNHFPNGFSIKTVNHYTQVKNSGEFRRYDFGVKKNRELYGSDKPPNYNLTNIKVPMALYKAPNDYLTDLQDVDSLINFLPNVVFDYLIEYSNFNHMDFVVATNAKDLLYKTFLEVLNRNK